MMIKAICFDADGVVVNPPLQYAHYLQETNHISREMTASFFNGVFRECLIGNKSLQKVLPPYLESWGWQQSVEMFIQSWLEKDDVVDTVLLKMVQQLRDAGITCCLTTNQEQNRAMYMRKKMGFEAIFDHCFISCEMGCQKPDAAYYGQIENELGIPSNEILFWDDSKGHVEAARNRGWMAEVYTGYDEFVYVMKEKYILNWHQ